MSTPPPIDPSAISDEDAYVDRLRSVDPAAGAATDLAALRAAVADRADRALDPADELAARRRSRYSWPARVAAAAAAVLVVGSGGYAVGVGRATPPPTQGAAPVISLSGEGAARDGSVAVAPQPAKVDGAQSSASTGDRALSGSGYGGWWGRTVFTSSGLSTAAGRAEAWALDASATFSEATATAAATALGLSGAPTLAYGAWQVGPNDGSGPSLTLSPDGQGSLSYYDPTVDPWGCANGSAVAPSSDGSGAPVPDIAPAEPSCTERDLGPAPGSDEAATRLRDVLTALGIDASTYEVVAENYGEPQWTYVTAYQVVNGQRTGVTWSAAMTGAGLSSLNGSTAALVSLGEYDVISPAAAVDRLGDARFGASGGYPLAMDATRGVAEGTVSSDAAPAQEQTVPPAAKAGQSFSWPVQAVQITQARLGLAMVWETDGAVVLAPTYELTGADGSTWTVIAVSDAALDFSAAG